MKRFRRAAYDNQERQSIDTQNNTVSKLQEFRCRLRFDLMKITGVFIVCLMILSVLFSASIIFKDPTIHSLWSVAESSRVLDSKSYKVPKDKLLSGLLPPGLDEKSCVSRYQSTFYGRGLSHQPSAYLISRLRSYENLHKRCGPYTESYNRTLLKLKSGEEATDPSDCKYLVWISYSGLGNRILTLASAFLYAVLTNRVFLVDRGADIPDLFCEPFPEVSWLLPLDFPIIKQFNSFDQKSPESHGNILKNNNFGNSSGSATRPFVYLHLAHDYGDHDKLFFCDQDQSVLRKVPWLIMKTDNYFIPSLFLISSFEQELSQLFPEKETVFHFLGRYLLHPTNSVWGLVTRYYESYLAKADEKIGIQVRVFDSDPGPFQHVLDQILDCALKEDLLPKFNQEESFVNPFEKPKTKAVLVTSLNSGYSEAIRDKYWESSTSTGEVISVHQPSHEGYQQTEKHMHNRKAWAEMYLLSLTDKLVTSSWSTFGYVAQGLGGLKPWILYKPENRTAPNPPCRRAMSMEPCFHAPPFYDCKNKVGIDTGALVPHVRHCEDMSWGLKLVDHRSEA